MNSTRPNDNAIASLSCAEAISRREFIKAGAAGAGGLMLGALEPASSPAAAMPAPSGMPKRPNFLFILCDQLSLNVIAAHGCRWARTPNLDRLIARGVTFMESHSTNPVCSPARSSLFTGRMPVETGVISNNLPIIPSIPNMGHWFSQHGYQTVYCGKWHIPGGSPGKGDGFTVLPQAGSQGCLKDGAIGRSCEAWLHNYKANDPFVLVASPLQPHDICYWAIHRDRLVPEDPELPFANLKGLLPELPPNNAVRPPAPPPLDKAGFMNFTPGQWRYYLYNYYRMVEMLDADVGRMLDALEDSGKAGNTIVIFTSDHGEGGGRHGNVQKWFPYEESVKVPLIISCPGRLSEGARDGAHLVSGLDVMSTMCDYAGIPAPPRARGLSLRPLLENRQPDGWREFVVSEHHNNKGRMVRTADWKFVRYKNEPIEQLFDMKRDPWEMKNLYDVPKYSDVVREHRKLLDQWEAKMLPAPRVASLEKALQQGGPTPGQRKRPKGKARPKAVSPPESQY